MNFQNLCEYHHVLQLRAPESTESVAFPTLRCLEVRDIYGGDYKLPNGSTLPGSMTASFFGRPHLRRWGVQTGP